MFLHFKKSQKRISSKVGETFNTTQLNISCSILQMECISGKNDTIFKFSSIFFYWIDANYTNPAKMIDVVHYNHCCAYNHQARGPFDYFDEFYNNTKLDRYSNFTLFLEIGHNVTLPEKCMNLTCKQVSKLSA